MILFHRYKLKKRVNICRKMISWLNKRVTIQQRLNSLGISALLEYK